MGFTAAAVLLLPVLPMRVDAQPATWRLGPEPAVQIGVEDGDPSYLFARITQVHRLSGGRIVVADAAGLRYYDRGGRFIRTAAAYGRGPAEVRSINGLVALGGDSLVLWDGASRSRLVFDAAGEFVSRQGVLTSHSDTRQLSFEFSWMLRDGTLLSRTEPPHRAQAGRVERRTQKFVLAKPVTGQIIQLGTYSAAVSYVVTTTPRALHAWQPFSPQAYFAAGPDVVYIGDSARPHLDVYRVSDGSPESRLVVRRTPPAVQRSNLEHELQRRLGAVSAADHPVVRRLWAQAPKPDRLPYFGGLLADADGNLWVMDYRTRPDTESAWTVMSRSGVELARVRMPARFTAMQITRDHVLGVRRDELGVEYVQLWAFRRSS